MPADNVADGPASSTGVARCCWSSIQRCVLLELRVLDLRDTEDMPDRISLSVFREPFGPRMVAVEEGVGGSASVFVRA